MNTGGRSAFGFVWAIAAVLSSCDVASSATSEPSASGASGASGAGIAGIAGARAADVPIGETSELAMSGGRVTSAELGIQGTVVAVADSHSALDMTSNLTPPVGESVVNACIAGMAAKVDQLSEVCINHTFTPPATDCWAEFSGVGVEMNLNQGLDAQMGEASAKALAFDASALQGFAFDLDGATVPGPVSLRFSVESDDGVFCNVPTVKLHAGSNAVLFSQLVDRCFRITDDPPNPTAETVQSKLVKLSWRVVPNDSAAVPFDFCISNVRAILK